MSPNWKHGSGRWVRDVLVWSKAPLMLRNELVPVDHLACEQHARGGEVKRLGDKPFVIEFASDGASIQVAVKAAQQAPVTGPFTAAAAPTPSAAAWAEQRTGDLRSGWLVPSRSSAFACRL
jgi:hypothetical protein